MITLHTSEGRWLKTMPETETSVVFHEDFGFVTERQLSLRSERRTRHGLRTNPQGIHCRFKYKTDSQGRVTVVSTHGCEFANDSEGGTLTTSLGSFRIRSANSTSSIPDAPYAKPLIPDSSSDRRYQKAALLAMLFFSAALLFGPRGGYETAPVVIEEPIKVTIVPETKIQKTVTVPASSEVAQRLKVQDQATRRAVQQNLGFLGLLGKKDLTKALGGMPSTIQPASAGAGKGGTEGSGGEYLVGLGQGVRQASVGNTGVAGLGGIGTKGKGGGAGGYGNSMVGSGEGKTLSKLALSNELTIEGGLDRAVIQATIAKYLSQIRACYEGQLQTNPGLSGQVNMGFVIQGDGTVASSQVVRSTLGNTATENCMTARTKTWLFPKPVGGVTVKVNYPFLLRPAGT